MVLRYAFCVFQVFFQLCHAARQQSSIRVVVPGEGDKGSVIELSGKMLQDGEILQWYCRENTDAESNSLDRKNPFTNSWVTVGRSGMRSDVGSVKNTVCDRDYKCTVLEGSIRWSREQGGTYRCSAYPNEQFTVYWVKPAVKASASAAYKQGDLVQLFCAVEMTPLDVNYRNIMAVQWQRSNPSTSNSWRDLPADPRYTNQIPEMGSNYSLVIDKFSGVLDGGEYRCIASIDGLTRSLTSDRFEVRSPIKAHLKNDKRKEFKFGLGERVTIDCLVDSYPYPQDVAITVDRRHVSLFQGWKGETDVLQPVDGALRSWVIIDNVTESLNNSKLECVATGADKIVGRDVVLIEVLHEVPIDINPNAVSPRLRTESKKGWEIAVAIIVPVVIILIVALVVIRVKKYKLCRHAGYHKGQSQGH